MAWKCVKVKKLCHIFLYIYNTYSIHIKQMGRQRKYRGKGKMAKMYRHSANKNE